MANLTVTLSENITLDGAVRGNTHTTTITDIDKMAEKVVNCPYGEEAGATTIIGNWANVENAAVYHNYDYDKSKYIRVTNLHSTQHIEIAFVSNHKNEQCSGEAPEGTTPDSCRFRLEAGQSSIMWNSKAGKRGEITAPRFSSVAATDLSYIEVYNPTFGETATNVKVELFVASE